jgi:hypothetical protein
MGGRGMGRRGYGFGEQLGFFAVVNGMETEAQSSKLKAQKKLQP